MDLLHWRNLNKSVKVENTKKQYYSRYLWRLVYEIKKVNLATDRYVPDVVDFVKEKRRLQLEAKKYPSISHSNYYGHYSRHEDWTGIDEVLIDHVRTCINSYKDTVKFRCEYNTMQIYAECEDDLKRVAEAIAYNDGIVAITHPVPGTEDRLRSGHVFMSKIDYKYKVILRDGNYDVAVKENILAQLNHRADVKVPPQLKRELGKKYPALWGAYFYTNDDSIVTVLSLISPGIVGKIHPIDQHL